jgi:hypothetical protein
MIKRASDERRRQLLGELLADDWELGERQPLAVADYIRKNREEPTYGETLMKGMEPSEIDEKLDGEGAVETIAGGPLDGNPEFRQHECWRMLHVWPDESDETLPGKLLCPACGAVFRAELEYKP